MKFLVKENQNLKTEGRWDIDYHLPAEGIKQFPEKRLVTISELAHVSGETHNPTKEPETPFIYIDISSIDITIGEIIAPQDLLGVEAPSRARKVIRAYDVIVSTVRPTRGAIAVIPQELDNQICSTGFCVLQCRKGVNPYYLQFVLRLGSTLEQLRKFSTGSSYPAVLDEDVLNTLVPKASIEEQDAIAKAIVGSRIKRKRLLERAQYEFGRTVDAVTVMLQSEDTSDVIKLPNGNEELMEAIKTDHIERIRNTLIFGIGLFEDKSVG